VMLALRDDHSPPPPSPLANENPHEPSNHSFSSLNPPLKSALNKSQKSEVASTLSFSSPLHSASIVSTASTKLSYLMDRITFHQKEEKILIFYESDNVAYYIAQGLECMNIKHLIYSKHLTPEKRSQYVAAFQSADLLRVLLMDVSQAAFGLDVSSASRVYFVNPVFSPYVEAQ
jgi:SNF2 family DNA or RNA helicase